MNSIRKHIMLGFITTILTFLFLESRSEWHPMHAWNRAVANVSLLYLMVIIILGPLTRLFPRLNIILSWRRVLGIWSGITAIAHIIIIFDGWIEWDLLRLFYIFTPFGGEWVLHPGFALANIIGIIGLIYYLLLMITSNNKTMKILGRKSWDFIQKRTNTLYLLVIIHTFYFLFLHNTKNNNWLQIPFIILVLAIVLLQLISFAFTVYKEKKSS